LNHDRDYRCKGLLVWETGPRVPELGEAMALRGVRKRISDGDA
jgi:hypothetical protein